MLRNEAIYSVIYRNSKISKKSRHILAYCTDPYLLTSVLIVCHSSLHAETLNCWSIRNKACLFCLQQTRLVTRNFYLYWGEKFLDGLELYFPPNMAMQMIHGNA